MDLKSRVLEISHLPRPEDSRLLGQFESNLLNDFLYNLASDIKPTVSVVLDSSNLSAAVHLAFGNSTGRVVALGSLSGVRRSEPLANFENIRVVQTGTANAEILESIKTEVPIDILFISSIVDKVVAQDRVNSLSPIMSDHGIILFENTRISKEMTEFWSCVTRDKVNLNHLHIAGLGAILP